MPIMHSAWAVPTKLHHAGWQPNEVNFTVARQYAASAVLILLNSTATQRGNIPTVDVELT